MRITASSSTAYKLQQTDHAAVYTDKDRPNEKKVKSEKS